MDISRRLYHDSAANPAAVRTRGSRAPPAYSRHNSNTHNHARTTSPPPRMLILSGFVCQPGDPEYRAAAVATNAQRNESVYWFEDSMGPSEWMLRELEREHMARERQELGRRSEEEIDASFRNGTVRMRDAEGTELQVLGKEEGEEGQERGGKKRDSAANVDPATSDDEHMDDGDAPLSPELCWQETPREEL